MRGREGSRERVEQRALAGPVRTQQRDQLSLTQLEGDIAHHVTLAPAHAEALAGEQDRAGGIGSAHVSARGRRRMPPP